MKLNFERMNDIVQMLYNRPSLTAEELRPFLRKYVPGYQNVDASYVRNFRNRVFQWNVTNGQKLLGHREALLIANNSAANEPIVGGSLIDSTHLQHLLSQLMIHGGCV